jgi:hypothetical protein
MLMSRCVRCVRSPFVFGSKMQLDGSMKLDGRIRVYECSIKITFGLLGPSRTASLFAVSDAAQEVNFAQKNPCPAGGDTAGNSRTRH